MEQVITTSCWRVVWRLRNPTHGSGWITIYRSLRNPRSLLLCPSLFRAALHSVVSGAECASEIAQCSRNDLNAVSLWSPLDFFHKACERVKQRGSCFRDPSAKNNDFGIQRINYRGDSCGQIMDRSQPDLCCLGIARQMSLDQFAR